MHGLGGLDLGRSLGEVGRARQTDPKSSGGFEKAGEKVKDGEKKLEQEQAKVKQMETAVVVKKESGSPWWAAKKKKEEGKC